MGHRRGHRHVLCVVGSVVRALSSSVIRCLRWFGEARRQKPDQSLHEGVAHLIFRDRSNSEALLLFQLATQELILRKLLYMDYRPRGCEAGDVYGMGATELGWAVIRKL